MIQIFGVFLLSFLSFKKTMTTVRLVIIPEEAMIIWRICMTSYPVDPSLSPIATVSIVTASIVILSMVTMWIVLYAQSPAVVTEELAEPPNELSHS